MQKECAVEFTAGHEFSTLKTEKEKRGFLQAWYTDIPPDFHIERVSEERKFLTKDDSVFTKFTTGSFFSANNCNRMIPIGISKKAAIAVEIQSKDEALRIKNTYQKSELDQMIQYFKELMKKAKTQEQTQPIVRELSVLIQADEFLKENLLFLATEIAKLRESLPSDPHREVDDKRGSRIEHIDNMSPSYGKAIIPKVPENDIKFDDSQKENQYVFRIHTCVIPLKSTTPKTTHKRCIWKPKPTIYLCDTNTTPVVKICSNREYLLVCYLSRGKLHVELLHIEDWVKKFSSVFDISERIVDCDYDAEYDRLIIASETSIFSHYLQVPKLIYLIKLNYKDSTPAIASVSARYNEFIIGTTRGEVILFDSQSTPTKCHLMTTACSVLKTYRNGANLYAMNIMNTMNLETGDERFFARGVTISMTGRLFCNDRVISSDSCGALVVTLNKYGTLQIQPNRECPDPNEPDKLMQAAIYSNGETYKRDSNGIFIHYDAIIVDRTEITCLYPNGMIQCVWIKKELASI